MAIFVLPISGGAFPVQLALMLEAGISPKLMLGASGGNIAAYLYSACDGNETKLKEIVSMINKNMFISGSKIGAFLRGHFLKGKGVEELFSKIFTEESIQKHEIITLTCSQDEMAPRVFSNKNKNSSFFGELDKIDDILFQIKEVEHLDGKMNEIAIITMASASIPGLVEPQIFNGKRYSDGGVCYASAFTPLSSYIRDKLSLETTREPVQMIYMACYNMKLIGSMESQYQGKLRHILEIAHFATLQDRANAIDFVSHFGSMVLEEKENVSRDQLRLRLSQIQNKNYAMILYPQGYPEINIIDFTPQNILDVMEIARQNYSYYLWVAE